MTDTRKLKVFICHASQDKPVVRKIYQRLIAESWIDPWLDEKELLPGQDWDMEIEKAVDATDAVLVCLSNNSVTKEGYVQHELRLVLDAADQKPEGRVFVIPIRLDDCAAPRRLKIWQYVDFFSKNRAVAYKKLIKSLELRAREISIPIQSLDVKALKTILETDLPAHFGAVTADLLRTPSQHNAFAALARMSDPAAISYMESLTPYGMVFIPAGKFLMGSERFPNEQPVVETWVNSFYMARFPVTNADYWSFIEDDGYSCREYWTEAGWDWVQNQHRAHPWKWTSQCYLEKARYPAEWLSWYEAMAYACWRSIRTGALFRLPTEAEWEKAASWDAKLNAKREYPWGDIFDGTRCNLGAMGTQPVGHFSPEGDSAYGVADMVGQIWQWTSSLRKPYPYYADADHEDPEALGERVFRGGCWANYGGYVRCASRYAANLPIWPFMNTNGDYEGPCGLRLVLGPAPWISQVLK